MKKLIPLSVLLLASSGIVACGSQPAKAPSLSGSFVNSSLGVGAFGDGSWVGNVYQADLYDNGCYRYIETSLNYGYSMLLSTTVKINYGTYEKGASEDGVTAYTLNAASEVFFNAYSKAGGFSIVIETPTQTYPVEMVAKTQGEKNMANSKDDVIKEYGAGAKIFATEASHAFSFVDPATDEVPSPVTAASGDASSLLKAVKDFQIVNEFTSPASYGEGSWEGDAHIVTIFEDGSYEYINTSLTYGFSMLLSTSTLRAEGKATVGNFEDGWAKASLAKADEVLMNASSKAGGFAIQIDTRTAEYPVEMVAKAQGEKNMANSKDDVLNEYGYAREFYLSDSAGTMSIENPNE